MDASAIGLLRDVREETQSVLPKRRLGEDASPEGLTPSFRTGEVAEPVPSLRSGQAL